MPHVTTFRLFVGLLIFSLGLGVGYFVFAPPRSLAPAPSARIGIPEFVQEVRTELIESDLRRMQSHQPPLFTAKDVDLEISFVVRKSADGGGKISLEVIELDGKGQVANEKTQKMTLHLEVPPPQRVEIPPAKGELQ